ncbi:MAG: hypothetical protein CMJ31_08105 [Phycisphaerae bacterium]|nr:hypothetical protein [Phycisphaerae bacterium]
MSPRPAAEGRPFRLWACGALDLHDRLWATRGVQVIRATAATTPAKDASLYLLLAVDQLVRFSLPDAIARLHWLSPEILKLRIISSPSENYRESVVTSTDDAFLGFRRQYGRRGGATGRAWLTSSAAIARVWADANSQAEATHAIRSLAKKRASAPLETRGMSVDHASEREFEAWLADAIGPEDRVDAAFAGVFEHAEGVWVHYDAEVDPSATLVAPLWIGAGARIGADDLLVGPAVVEDSDGLELQQPPVDWIDMRSYHWGLPPLRAGDRGRLLAKRCFDIVFGLAALLLTAPLFPLTALAILIEDGRPVFFTHTRQTRGGAEFPCIKFRTMVKNAEDIKANLQKANQADGPQFFMDDDPRLLRVGKLLRKLQIDELPQFINVLLGHMSVVGPRPSPEKENQYCPAWREARLSVRPGVTGLWQVRRTRAADTDFQEWIRYDLQYVRHQSMWRDIGIIVETVWRIFVKPAATRQKERS